MKTIQDRWRHGSTFKTTNVLLINNPSPLHILSLLFGGGGEGGINHFCSTLLVSEIIMRKKGQDLNIIRSAAGV